MTGRSDLLHFRRLLIVVGLTLAAYPALAQVAEPNGDDEAGADSNLVQINLPENMELKLLVDLVSERLDINILYDEQIGGKRITLKAPTGITEQSLLGVLESALRMNGLALVEADQEGWKKIVAAQALVGIARGPRADEVPPKPGVVRATPAVTRVIDLRHADPQKVDQVIKPFLSQPGGNSIAIPEQDRLILTDYVARMPRLLDLVRLLDQPPARVATAFVDIQHVAAPKLAEQVRGLLTARKAVQGGPGGEVKNVQLAADERTNQVIVIGLPERVEQTLKLIKALDVPLGLMMRVYRFEATAPARVDRLIRELIGPLAAERLYHSAIDQIARLLIVTTTAEIHERVARIKENLDVPVPPSESPVRFYKLENAKAAEVLETLRAIEGEEGGLDEVALETLATASQRGQALGPSGPNLPPSPPGEPPPVPPAYVEPELELEGEAERRVATELERDIAVRDEEAGSPIDALRPAEGGVVRSDRATVVADVNTNSIIVIAEPSVQRIYARLIEALDRRRPQVLIEMTLVTLDTSDSFSLGVEIGGSGDIDGDGRVITFSSFGLSEVDPTTGQLRLTPGLGFNGAVVSSSIADVIIRALKSNARARVVSAPRLLVNDNATGVLDSVNEQPFTSVNAFESIATTSFAGFAEAGTNITLTPHISQGDHLNLEYAVTLSSFTGEGSETVPPPRQRNTVASEVTVPDGYTVIIGGINRADTSETVQSVPILGQIPLIKHLFRNFQENESRTTLFVFIRPVILRDDQFEELKFLSRPELKAAGLPPNAPRSLPMLMR